MRQVKVFGGELDGGVRGVRREDVSKGRGIYERVF